MENKTKYTHRFIARIVLEAATPLAIASGEKDITTDALVATDVNGLPYIPGTSLAGIIRHAIGDDVAKDFFGYQSFGKSTDGKGSEIIFTDAKMIGKDGKAIDGLQKIDWNTDFYAQYKELPIRQHARIDYKGVTVNAGKFDEQVVFKGTRFCFEIEMVSDGNNFDKFEQVLKQLSSETFRIGSGTRCGFGKMKIVSDLCKTKILDLKKSDDLNLNLEKSDDLDFYLKKSSSLSEEWNGDKLEVDRADADWTKYELTLKPEDFFLFGSGFGDDDADMTPVKEDYVDWSNGKPEFKENAVLIPATSIKGALAHRVAFYYNKLNEFYAGDERAKVGNENKAVQELFGYENQSEKIQVRGNVIFSDIIENQEVTDKILNHVSIDRFTGGAIGGALFTEKTTYGKGQSFETTILVNNTAFSTDKVQDAFENALNDICSGMLPLGGGVNRGNGCFSGELKRNEEIIYPKNGGNEK